MIKYVVCLALGFGAMGTGPTPYEYIEEAIGRDSSWFRLAPMNRVEHWPQSALQYIQGKPEIEESLSNCLSHFAQLKRDHHARMDPEEILKSPIPGESIDMLYAGLLVMARSHERSRFISDFEHEWRQRVAIRLFQRAVDPNVFAGESVTDQIHKRVLLREHVEKLREVLNPLKFHIISELILATPEGWRASALATVKPYQRLRQLSGKLLEDFDDWIHGNNGAVGIVSDIPEFATMSNREGMRFGGGYGYFDEPIDPNF